MLVAPATALASAFGGCGVASSLGSATAAGGSFSATVSSGVGGAGGLTIGTGGASVGELAAPCSDDIACGADLQCLGPSSSDPIFGGGAPNGFCTKACLGDAECASLGGVCYRLDPSQPGRCTLPCTLGPGLAGLSDLFNGKLSADKCRGRPDLRCARVGATTTGVCLPTCGDDAECAGRHCDPRTAVCVDAPSTGMPEGAPCDPTSDASTCAGLCVGFQTGSAMCSDPCVLGANPDGGGPLPDDCGGPGQGFCAFHPPANGAGDMGYCTPSCSLQSDCQNPSFWCFRVPELTPLTQKGYCFAATPCPKGQADCEPSVDAGAYDAGAWDADGGDGGLDAGGADAAVPDGGTVCTATPLGSFCLDPMFALGTSDGGLDGAAADGGAAVSEAGPEDAGESG